MIRIGTFGSKVFRFSQTLTHKQSTAAAAAAAAATAAATATNTNTTTTTIVIPSISNGSIRSLSGSEWRKDQLRRLEEKFEKEAATEIQNDDELQPMWKEMESRVTRRKSRTISETGGKTGRSNIRPTDEEAWLGAGLYDKQEDNDNNNDNDRDDQGK